MSAVKYQTMPPLSMEEYAALEESIREMGVQVPILVDERGVVIDGHHRQKIAQDLGIECPREVRHLLPEEEKRKLSIRLNIDRRQLSREQRRAIIASSLIAAPEKSNREHARDAGVSHVTVATVRDALESTGQIDQLDKTTGADGKERPAQRQVQQIKHTETVEEITVDAVTGEVLDNEEPERIPAPSNLHRPKPVLAGDAAQKYDATQFCKTFTAGLTTMNRLNYQRIRDLLINEYWPLAEDEVAPIHRELFNPTGLRSVAEALIQLATDLEKQK